MFLDEIRNPGLDPKKVEFPTTIAKKIEGKLDDLEREIDALGDALDQAVDKQATVPGDGATAQQARQLLDDYKASHKKIKAMGAEGKKILSAVKKASQAVQKTQVADSAKLLAVIHKMHQNSQEFEEMVLKEAYRCRDASGDLQTRLTALGQKDGFDIAMNQPFRDWRATIFDVIRLCTLPGGAIKDEIDEALEYVISFGGASAGQGESLAKRIVEERRELGLRYGSTGG